MCAEVCLSKSNRPKIFIRNRHNLTEQLSEGRNCLINDAFNTFNIRLYGVGHIVYNHSDNERGNPAAANSRLLLRLAAG